MNSTSRRCSKPRLALPSFPKPTLTPRSPVESQPAISSAISFTSELMAWLEAIAGSSSLAGPPSRSTTLRSSTLPFRSQSATSRPDRAKPAMPTPPVPYHQVRSRSLRMTVALRTGSAPTRSPRDASMITAAATAASGQYVVHSPHPGAAVVVGDANEAHAAVAAVVVRLRVRHRKGVDGSDGGHAGPAFRDTFPADPSRALPRRATGGSGSVPLRPTAASPGPETGGHDGQLDVQPPRGEHDVVRDAALDQARGGRERVGPVKGQARRRARAGRAGRR
jgi:hypothetical protein